MILRVRRPSGGEIAGAKCGAAVVAILDPFGHESALEELAGAGATAFAMEFMPRITRAQSMDVLSSQANIAGYRAVIDAAAEYGRVLPMMMTRGRHGSGGAESSSWASASRDCRPSPRRAGSARIVTATDVRPATKEQVESLGAKFIAVENDEFKQAETSGGYAKEMSAEYQAAQAELIGAPYRQAGHRHHHGADPGPSGAEARLGRAGALDARRFGDRRSRRRARRQLRIDASPARRSSITA